MHRWVALPKESSTLRPGTVRGMIGTIEIQRTPQFSTVPTGRMKEGEEWRHRSPAINRWAKIKMPLRGKKPSRHGFLILFHA
jgi:hypothetical protein